MSGFQQALSGLNASARQLDAIGNNVANASTVGFKQSQAQFADMYAASVAAGGTALQIGTGGRVSNIAQSFTQGNITNSNNTLDTAISGKGFFRVDDGSGSPKYTRNGQFQVDKNGFIVNAQGHFLTGNMANAAGTIVDASTKVRLQITPLNIPAVASANVVVGANINANNTIIPAATVFNAATPGTYNNSTSMTVYDSLGATHNATLYFKQTAALTTEVYYAVDGVQPTPGVPMTTLTFNSAGTLTTPAANALVAAPAFTPTSGTPAVANGAAAQVLSFNFNSTAAPTTQYGASFGVSTLSQDGYTKGDLTGFTTGTDGIIQGRYSNGQTHNIGRMTLDNFTNPQGLQNVGGNEWIATISSGQAIESGTPGVAGLGTLQSSAVEESNVDLTAELVNMITAQRIYQANSQSVSAQNQLLTTIVNLR